MTEKIKRALHLQQEDSGAVEAPVEVADQTMEKVVGGVKMEPKDRRDNAHLNAGGDIVLPEIP